MLKLIFYRLSFAAFRFKIQVVHLELGLNVFEPCIAVCVPLKPLMVKRNVTVCNISVAVALFVFYEQFDFVFKAERSIFHLLAHEFALIESESEDEDADPVLSLTPSVGQGFGNTQRVRGYFAKERGSEEALDHGGLMDTTLQLDLTWNVCDHVSFGAYVAYSDYIFDSNMRHGARAHNAEWGKGCDESWNVYGGLSMTVSF